MAEVLYMINACMLSVGTRVLSKETVKLSFYFGSKVYRELEYSSRRHFTKSLLFR